MTLTNRAPRKRMEAILFERKEWVCQLSTTRTTNKTRYGQIPGTERMETMRFYERKRLLKGKGHLLYVTLNLTMMGCEK